MGPLPLPTARRADLLHSLLLTGFLILLALGAYELGVLVVRGCAP